MATTLKARAGSSLRVRFSYVDSEGEFVTTTGSTPRIQLRDAGASSRVLLEATAYIPEDEEAVPDNTIFAEIEPGHWELFLGKTRVLSFPPTVRWELELENDDNAEDSLTLENGVILVEPQAVTSIG